MKDPLLTYAESLLQLIPRAGVAATKVSSLHEENASAGHTCCSWKTAVAQGAPTAEYSTVSKKWAAGSDGCGIARAACVPCSHGPGWSMVCATGPNSGGGGGARGTASGGTTGRGGPGTR